MIMKKQILASVGVVTLLATPIGNLPSFVDYIQPMPLVFAQGLTPEQSTELETIKNNLAAVQPINLEQLSKVDDQKLWDLYQKVNQTQSGEEMLKVLYDQVATQHPELELLTGQDYTDYQAAAREIEAHSQYSYSDLNTALPKDILAWYKEAQSQAGEDVQAAVDQIVPQIDQARQAYMERKAQREAQTTTSQESETTSQEVETTTESITEPTPETTTESSSLTEAESSSTETEEETTTETTSNETTTEETTTAENQDLTQLKKSLVDHAKLQPEQLKALGDDVLKPYVATASASDFDSASAQVIASALIQAYPDQFSQEQIKAEFDRISQTLVKDTPLKAEELSKMDMGTVLTTASLVNQEGGDPTTVYNKLMEVYPEIQAHAAQSLRQQLVKAHYFSQEDLDSINNSDLVWAAYPLMQADQTEPKLADLANQLSQQFGLALQTTTQETTTQEQTTIQEKKAQDAIEPFKAALVDHAGIQAEQLERIGNRNLEEVLKVSQLQLKQLNSQDLDKLALKLISVYPDMFNANQVKQAADRYRHELVETTPMTQAILDHYDDQTILKWQRQASQQKTVDPYFSFRQSISQDLDLYRDLLNQAKDRLAKQTGIKREKLDQIPSQALLIAIHENGGMKGNYSAVLSQLQKDYPQVFAEAKKPIQTSQTTTENQSKQDPKKIVKKTVGVEAHQKKENKGFLPATGETPYFNHVLWLASSILALAVYCLRQAKK
ncbi:hypothetical protein [Vaginisenegalia massiliensis]|uniref:hypothetical protein n=1 Tax=Vaginisenegalia massiliensis TaxID=2058294 RepID=UPI000F545A74|nr:hypothetical protein [Vaginisenegalia massiliensis]